MEFVGKKIKRKRLSKKLSLDFVSSELKIAKDHLGTSFNLLKSNGYKHWIKNK